MIELTEKAKAWVDGVPFDQGTQEQVLGLAAISFVYPHVAVMPDAHFESHGATVGTVIPTLGAVIPAVVGVDPGCGVLAIKTSLSHNDLPDNLAPLYDTLAARVPVGERYFEEATDETLTLFSGYVKDYHALVMKYPRVDGPKVVEQLGTVGSGNHFVELSIDGDGLLWIMVHSGSRGVGARLGRYFIEAAKAKLLKDGLKEGMKLPSEEMAPLLEGEPIFKDYVRAMRFAQDYAGLNRRIIVDTVIAALRRSGLQFSTGTKVVSCHHNYIAKEKHYGKDVWVARKGAVYAGKGSPVIIPGSMGTASFIGVGLGNEESLSSCSHGAGRSMSRREAKEKITLHDHMKATEFVMCRRDKGVLDESPEAYKNIHHVMAAQRDLVEITTELHPALVLKG